MSLKSVIVDLGAVVELAGTAQQTLSDTLSAAQEAKGQLAGVREEVASLGADAKDSAAQIIAGSVEAHRKIELSAEKSAQAAEKSVERYRAKAKAVREEVEGISEAFDTPAEKLDEFLKKLAEAGTGETKKLLEVLDLIKLGVIDAEKAIEIYRGAKLGAEELGDVLRKLDIGQLSDEIQDLVKRMRQDAVDFDEIMSFLGERSGDLGRKIKAWVEALKAGNLDFEEFRKRIEAFGDEFGGEAIQSFLDELTDGLRDGDL